MKGILDGLESFDQNYLGTIGLVGIADQINGPSCTKPGSETLRIGPLFFSIRFM